MKKTDAILILKRQISEIKKVKATARFGPTFSKWQRDTRVALSNVFAGDENPPKEFDDIPYSLGVFASSTPDSAFDEAYLRGLEQAEAFLESCITEISDYWSNEAKIAKENQIDPQLFLEKICSRFHLVARQLRHRYDKRETINIGDEYDVQDLLHGMLRIFFDDIRPEEWTPSYVGKSSRMDFLLKDYKTVIETKMTRKGLGAKEIGTQLIEDIARYKKHPDCCTLVCFVYDPDGLIANPAGIENDLGSKENGLNVRVIIRPSGH